MILDQPDATQPVLHLAAALQDFAALIRAHRGFFIREAGRGTVADTAALIGARPA